MKKNIVLRKPCMSHDGQGKKMSIILRKCYELPCTQSSLNLMQKHY